MFADDAPNFTSLFITCTAVYDVLSNDFNWRGDSAHDLLRPLS